MKQEKRMTLQLYLAVIMVLFGICLLVFSILWEPVGEIHYSVLTAYGETLTFVGALLGLDYHYRSTRSINEKED